MIGQNEDSPRLQKGRAWSTKHLSDERSRSWLDWWYRLSAPVPPSLTADLEQREIARRGRLTSIVLLYSIAVSVFLALPVAIYQNHALIPVVCALVILMVVCLYFNRSGKINHAGIVMVCIVFCGLGFAIVSAPGGLSTNIVFLYDMMIQIELIAVSLLPPSYVFFACGASIAFIVGDYFLQPHTADLTALIARSGPEVLARPVVLHIIVSVVTYLWVRSSQEALKRADRAQVIAELQHELAEQNAAIAQEKQKLDASITHIVYTLTEVAKGNLDARVPLSGEYTLWEVVGSINNLLSRYQRARYLETQAQRLQSRYQEAARAEHELQQIKHQLQLIAQLLHRAKDRRIPMQLANTGTELDILLKEIQGSYILSPFPSAQESK